MKVFVSVLVILGFQFAPAAGKEANSSAGKAAEGAHGEAEAHKDWNEVFKQPEKNPAKSTLPTQTQLVEPGFLAKISDAEVTLKWKAVEGDGIKYHLQVATDPNFKWLVVNQPLVSFTEYTVKELKKDQQYFWRVYTQKPDNMATYSKSAAASSAFVTAE
jgi:hypothetical protein